MRFRLSTAEQANGPLPEYRLMYPFCAPLLEPIFGCADAGSGTGGVLEELLNGALEQRDTARDARAESE
jgi:hypothetical protein